MTRWEILGTSTDCTGRGEQTEVFGLGEISDENRGTKRLGAQKGGKGSGL